LHENTEIAQQSITTLVEFLPESSPCSCQNALETAIITNRAKISPEIAQELALLVDKYLK
jgi:hypothetical protein